MSVTLMAKAFALPADVITSTETLVLLALADSANDEDGQTWIPIKRKKVVQAVRADGRVKLDLVRKTKLGIRAIQFALRSLEARGHLSRQEVPGKGVIYTIHPAAGGEADQGARDESDSGRIKCGVNLNTPRGESDSPKTKETINLYGEGAPANPRCAEMEAVRITDLGGREPGPDASEDTRATLFLPTGWRSTWADFLAMRKTIKSPVGPAAAEVLFRSLVKMADLHTLDGHAILRVIEQSTVNSWKGFWPLKNEGGDERTDHKGRSNGDGGANNPMVRAAIDAASAGHPSHQ
jgi:hypothetical protein